MKRLIIDIYGAIDETYIGSEIAFDEGDIRCPETGEQYIGKFIITELQVGSHLVPDEIN